MRVIVNGLGAVTPRPCIEPSCPRLAATGSRCPEHERQHKLARDAQRPSGSGLKVSGSTRGYRKARAIQLRHEPVCQVVGCSQAAVTVHHLTPREHGGTDAPTNLVSVCKDCHKAAHRESTTFVFRMNRHHDVGPWVA